MRVCKGYTRSQDNSSRANSVQRHRRWESTSLLELLMQTGAFKRDNSCGFGILGFGFRVKGLGPSV